MLAIDSDVSTFVVYKGPSTFTGRPIIAILTGADGSSKNEKTGPMGQLWILSLDEDPAEAQRSGRDEDFCGDCGMRPIIWRDNGRIDTRCYVQMRRGPMHVWYKHRDKPVDVHGACLALARNNVPVRLGALGDPAAIPAASFVIQRLALSTGRWTGYTHQWRKPEAQWLRPFCMASVESAWEQAAARLAGWRTFRVVPSGGNETAMRKVEIVCPYETRKLQCYDCGLCDGSFGKAKSIAIHAH